MYLRKLRPFLGQKKWERKFRSVGPLKAGENGKNSPFVYFGLNLGILYYISEISGSSDRSGEKQKLPTPLCKKSKFVMTCSWLPMHVSTNIKSLYHFFTPIFSLNKHLHRHLSPFLPQNINTLPFTIIFDTPEENAHFLAMWDRHPRAPELKKSLKLILSLWIINEIIWIKVGTSVPKPPHCGPTILRELF